MHCQMYDVDEEFEPRVTPKPITKLDHFAVPSVPEVSLIFEKPMKTRNLNDGDISSSSARTAKLMQCFDKPIEHVNIKSPNSGNHSLYVINPGPTSLSSSHRDSYTTWKKQVYSKENNYVNKAHVSPCKNIYIYNHVPQSNTQDVTVQKQQEQDKISDLGPTTQNRLINMRHNDGIHEKSVKFRCSNTKDLLSHDDEHETQLLSSDKRQLISCDPLQGPTCLTDARVPSNTFVDTLKQNEHLQMPYTPCPYPFQQFYPPSYSNRNIDNNETVKTLLQLVNNQSEQIKTLQSQVDRLVRLQEESFRNKSNCACSSSHANQVFGYSAINYDTTNTCTQSHNQVVNQNAIQSPSMIENKSPENLDKEKDNNKLDVALLEQQSKKAFVEQKVSIGVMTSFEFTVQNSPFLVDSEMYKEKEIPAEESDDINGRSTMDMHDTPESVKRYKNTFTRKSGTAQLENIVEDTESYLSSSHQQSSNFNASSSMKDSERHTPKQPDLYNTNNISESTRMYQHLVTDPNREKMREREMYVKKGGSTDELVQRTEIIPNTFRKASGPETASYDKMFAAKNVHDYIAMDKGKDNERINSSSNKRNLHDIQLPTMNYYQSRKNKEPDTNVRETGNVDDSIILSGGELKILERPPPTPEPSIHVDMQEYMSDDESDKFKRTSKIGWTFYNNVLGQVNEILQNSSIVEDKEHQEAKPTHRVEQEDDTEARTLNTVKAATLEQLRKLGISITDEHRELNVNNKTLDYDSSYYPRLDRQANMMHTTSVVNETNTSMHMKALALKYLGDDELTDIALHKQGSSSLKQLMVSNMQGTNMSFATMRYLERYQLLPGRNQDVQTEDKYQDTDPVYTEVAPKRDFKPMTGKKNPALRQFPLVQTPGTTCPSRILDISRLKRQPKLM